MILQEFKINNPKTLMITLLTLNPRFIGNNLQDLQNKKLHIRTISKLMISLA